MTQGMKVDPPWNTWIRTLILGLLFVVQPCLSANETFYIDDNAIIVPDEDDTSSSAASEACKTGVDLAYKCFTDGLDIARATQCNWALTMPWLYECVQSQLHECPADLVLYFDRMLLNYNTTLNGDTCTPACADQRSSINGVATCKTKYDGYAILISEINSAESVSSSSALCGQLAAISACIETAIGTCTALKQIYYKESATDGSNLARKKCTQQTPSLPSTVAPLPNSIKLINDGKDIADNEETQDSDTGGVDPGTNQDEASENGNGNVIIVDEENTEETDDGYLGDVKGIPLAYWLLIGLGLLTIVVLAVVLGAIFCMRKQKNVPQKLSKSQRRNIDNYDTTNNNTEQEVEDYFKPSKLWGKWK